MVVTALHINCITQPTFAVKLILSKHLTDIAPLFLGSFGAMNSTYAFTMIQYLMKMCVKRQLLQRIQNLIAHNPGAHRKCLRRNTLISEKKRRDNIRSHYHFYSYNYRYHRRAFSGFGEETDAR